ncbi:MAG: FAD-binding protein [Acidobacteria bacterium]|nr:FAD-binding protein [Acidobacteriota bacterium]
MATDSITAGGAFGRVSEQNRCSIERILGAEHVRGDDALRREYGTDALGRGLPADLVVFPGSAAEIAAVARLCDAQRIPLTPRGAGTGYTGGAVPANGGVVLALDRLDRIKEIDEASLLAVVEPNVVTGALQAAVERVGLFYPPDPASLASSAIGGNVAECAGGPRAFKYGTTRRYLLGLEAVLPTGEIIRTGGKVVKNVVGYDLTQLLAGSEGTLAIITEATLRLVPKPAARRTLRAWFAGVDTAVAAARAVIAAQVVPAALELVDAASLAAARARGGAGLAPDSAGAMLLIEVDGTPAAAAEELQRAAEACESTGASGVQRAGNDAEREALWQIRRDLSLALRAVAPLKINHDVVVPLARIPDLFRAVDALRRELRLDIACFGHVGDGNIHVNVLVDPQDAAQMARAQAAERRLFEAVVALEGSISGEHGIGFTKQAYLDLELSPETIALMRRLKRAFDPNGILNPGKIFPEYPLGTAPRNPGTR